MVPCEFRCWGEYRQRQFPSSLCAALARSRNERPDTFACFGLRNTAWARIFASKTQRASGGWWFRRGEDSALSAKEKAGCL